MGLQRLHVAARYSEAAIFNSVVYLAGMVPVTFSPPALPI